MKHTKNEKSLCDFGGTKMPKTLGNTLLMNTEALSKIAFLPENERQKITENITKK
ncbi:MAG: hypothetical protein IKL40_01650 [Clostridia bacterium]|nr:hypothetical protein [Clostridia bacterium]